MLTATQAGVQLVCGALFLFAAKWLWEAFFSPLRAFDGPALAKVTDIWRAVATATYNVDATHRRLHQQYGSAVRIGPNCISISDPNLIRTIYATKNPWIKVITFHWSSIMLEMLIGTERDVQTQRCTD